MIPKRLNPFHWRRVAYNDTHGLRNRAWMFDNVSGVYDSKKKVWSFLLFYIDLRGFKKINDTFSHSDGNQVLVKFFKQLENSVRTGVKPRQTKSFTVKRNTDNSDVLVVREGGDEFLAFVCLGVADKEQLEKAEKVVENRIGRLRVVHKGMEVTSRYAVTVSTPSEYFADFATYFEDVDKKLTEVHAADSIKR